LTEYVGFLPLKTSFPEELKQVLERRETQPKAEWDSYPAAVLIPLISLDGVWSLLYTRRTDSLESHRGQVAFPGGRIDEMDHSPTQAALREACEEIGIDPDQVEVLGSMDPLYTITQFHVTPVIGLLDWPVELNLNQSEVAAVFQVPIAWLAQKQNLEVVERTLWSGGPTIPIYQFKPYQGETIWGATARITLNLLEIMHNLPSWPDL
jgi:8-oxo-dGTP pyrophosphatase MutT (NUDIX family)